MQRANAAPPRSKRPKIVIGARLVAQPHHGAKSVEVLGHTRHRHRAAFGH